MRFLFLFFIRNAVRSRRVVWMTVLGLVPVAIAVVRVLAANLLGTNVDASGFFLRLTSSLYLHILLPLLSALIGTGIVAEEVEDRTLPYLLSRPIPKRRIVVSKSLSACLIVCMIIFLSLVVSYTLLTAGGGIRSYLSNLGSLFHITAVLCLGSLVYVPFFGMLGAAIKRPVLVGLLFAFGWENIVANFPSKIRLFTVVYYLKELLPQTDTTTMGGGIGDILDYFASGAALSPVVAVAALSAMFVVFSGITVSFLYLKEYRMEQG
ncbi:MAG: ABC transporter permease [bacterium]|nr:MAG: ABC transporter permease [bacterium]